MYINNNCGNALRMDRISDLRLEQLVRSEFLRPLRLHYKQDGRDKIWDLSVCHDAVYIVIYNTSRKKLVLVKQFRPVVYLTSLRRKLKVGVG